LGAGAPRDRFGLGRIPHARRAAALRVPPALALVAHERRHVMTGFHERIEHRAADVTGRSGQEDPHGGVYHSSVVARDTLIDFFHDFARARGAFLVYDDGFRSWSYSYEEIGLRARQMPALIHCPVLPQGGA